MIVVVRHGRTAANERGLLLGRADPPLDDTGRAQAKAIAAALDRPRVGRIVSSPLRRAVDTAAMIADAAGVDVEVDERWIELDYGSLDERPYADVPAASWAAWRADPSWAPPGGESLATLGVRVRRACQSLADGATEADVVVVSHVSPIKAAVAWALGVADDVAWRMFSAPGSITRIGVGEHGPVLRSFNETSHLDGPVD